jgi:DNA-directed RNA polymerase specialized sigma24 family protein
MGALPYHDIPLATDSWLDAQIEKYYKRLFFLGHYGLRNHLQTEYLMRQVLYDAYLHIEEWEKAGEIGNILITNMLDQVREVIANRRKLSEDEVRQRDALLLLLEGTLGLHQVCKQLHQALPPYDRMLFSLYYIEDYDVPEICAMLHTSAFRIRNRLDEIRSVLEELAGKYRN